MTVRTILVTGATGQVGRELLRQAWPAHVALLSPNRSAMDLSSIESITRYCADRQIDCIINPAAYTAVDRAEDHAGEAFLANAQGPAWLGDLARERRIPLLHVSTDYVFDGSMDRAYREDDPVAPLGVYGASKLAGELAVRSAAPRTVVLRTAWVISAHRNNFLKTMLRLAGEQPQLRVVGDQTGCPTGACDIADALRKIALRHLDDEQAPCGTYHFVNAGSTTWHGLAEEIMRASEALGGPTVPVAPIATADFPTRAKRPGNSRLESAAIERDYGITPRAWKTVVQEIVSELSAQLRETGTTA